MIKYVKVLSRVSIIAIIIILVVIKYVLEPALHTTLKRRFELQNYAYTKLKSLHERLKQSVKHPPGISVSYNGKLMVDRTVVSDDLILEEAREFAYESFKNETKRKSRTVENGNKEVRFSDGTPPRSTFTDINNNVDLSTTKLSDKIRSLKQKLDDFRIVEYKKLSVSGFSDGDPEMNSLLYQIKQFKTYLEVVTSEPPRDMLFKKPLSHLQVGRAPSKAYKFNYLDILNDNLHELKQKIGE